MTASRRSGSRASDGPLAGVTQRHLAALRAIAEERSFYGAAYSLGYVQSAVSHQIAEFERIVGARLVERQGGSARVALTEAGQLFLHHAAAIARELDAARAELSELAEGRVGVLRVGTSQATAAAIVPTALAELVQALPDVELRHQLVGADDERLDLLEQGRLDLAFADAGGASGPFERRRLLEDPMALLVSRRSSLAARESTDLGDIGPCPLIRLSATTPVDDEALAVLEAHGLSLSSVLEVELISTLQTMVAADLGVALVRRLAIEPAHRQTVAVELPALPRRTVDLLWHRDRERSPAAVLFTEIVSRTCATRWPAAAATGTRPVPPSARRDAHAQA